MLKNNTDDDLNISEALVTATSPIEDENNIILWAEELVSKYQIESPPVDIEKLATKVGIKEIHKADISIDGFLLPTQGGFVLTINKNSHPIRQRFTCAHEIAHTYFEPLDCELRRADNQEYSTQKVRDSELEHLCDIAATHMLMPNKMFGQASLKLSTSIEAISILANMFQTSIPSTAIRFVDTSRMPTILIFSQVYDKPNSSPKLRVRWSAQSKESLHSHTFYIPTFTPIKEDSKLYQAYKNESVCKGFEDLDIGNLKGAYYTESKSFHFGDDRYLISLIFLEAHTKKLL